MTTGNLAKMVSTLESPIRYALPLGDERVPLNPLLGETIRLQFSGEINCVACGRKTNKSYSQGHCYPCMRSLARCDLCIVKPELCHYATGTCREPEWGEQHCLQPHIVYLANSSGLKVGITRQGQIPTRWIDQGAHQALPILKVQSRLHSGLVEQLFKQQVNDKTDWRKMLKNEVPEIDLRAERDALLSRLTGELDSLRGDLQDAIEPLNDAEVVNLNYPVLEYPNKIKAHNFDKQPEIEGRLLGIKGQYLILDNGVLNIRKFGGYRVSLNP